MRLICSAKLIISLIFSFTDFTLPSHGFNSFSTSKKNRFSQPKALSNEQKIFFATKASSFSSLSSTSTSSSSSSSPNNTIESDRKNIRTNFLTIAIPALFQLAAEPLAGLVDTAYLGRLGPEVLGGAGVAISAQYAVSKLYNDPLLRTSISLVASQDGKTRDKNESNEKNTSPALEKNEDDDDLSIAVSSALLLAISVGVIQLFIYSIFCNMIIRGMGVSAENSMWYSATSYLKIRALGTPASTLWLVTNGVFRGLGDTKTPLFCSILFTSLNAIFDPIFIFTLGFGASGAAAGTALAQYIALIPLLFLLNRKINFNIRERLSDLGSSLKLYLKAGSLVLVRTFGKVFAYSVCAREAALLGPIAAAAYNLTFTLGFATTQICESIAIAAQTLLARLMSSQTDTKLAEHRKRSNLLYLMNGSMIVGAIVSISLSLLTYVQRNSVLNGLTTNLDIKQASLQIFPVVLLTQVIKGLAYPVNGIVMGALDWNFSMISMWLSNFVCLALMKCFKCNTMTLSKIWWALAAFMGVQVISGTARMYSGKGVWRNVSQQKVENEKSKY